MSRTSLPVLAMRLSVNVFLREHNNTLPKIEPLPTNNGLRQLLIADANILIGDDIYDENTDPFEDIICVLGEERREAVVQSIAAAEAKIRDRLQCRVAARHPKRATAAADTDDMHDVEKNADAERRRTLNTMLVSKMKVEGEVVDKERILRIMAIAQTAGKNATATDALETIMGELDSGGRWV
jgi:hypothetical protein